MAWAHVQTADNFLSAAGNGFTVTFGTTPTTGNKIIVAVVSTTPGPTITVKDGNSNALTQLSSVTNTGLVQALLFAYDVPATPSTTLTISSSNATMGAVAQEVSGLLAGNTSAMLDGTPGTTTGSISTGSASGPTYSSTAANEYLVQVFDDFGNSATVSTPSGYTGMDGENTNAVNNTLIAYKNSTGGSETVSWSSSNSWGGSTDQYALIAVAFKLAAGGSSPIPLPPNVVSQAVNRSAIF